MDLIIEEMTRDELKNNLLSVTKHENQQELKDSMELLNDQALHMCLNTFETRQGVNKAKCLIGLQVNKNNTVDVHMETIEGKFYGVSIML